MNKYKLLIHGTNLWSNADGQLEQCGFYAPRFVAAYTENAAKGMALEEFIAEPKWQDFLGGLQNPLNDPPQLAVDDEVDQIESFGGITNRYPGYALYKESKGEI